METAEYMSRRLLYTVCNVMCPIDDAKEPIYVHLQYIIDEITALGSQHIKFPKLKYELDDIVHDVCRVYKSIQDAFENKDSPKLIECLFVATHHMMVKYDNSTYKNARGGFVAISLLVQSCHAHYLDNLKTLISG